jgi:hypothetical protein
MTFATEKRKELSLARSSTVSPEDRAQISELISEYSYAFDEDRLSDYVGLFLEGAELSFYIAGSASPLVSTSTNDERLIVMQGIRSGELNRPGQPRHIQTNTVLQAVSPDRVTGRTMVICTQQPYDGSPCRVLFSGIYEDIFQRTDQGWRFAARKGRLDNM